MKRVEQPCRVCGGKSVISFLSRRGVPTHQNLICETAEAALGLTRGDLELGVCETCGFVTNLRFEPDKVNYNAQYDNTQSYSPYFDAYVSGLVERVIDKGVRQARIVEVGCGKGVFLRRLVAFPGAENTGYGFDPSYVGPEVDLDGRLRFIKELYAPNTVDLVGDKPVDAVVCRHVIEHIPDPVGFLKLIRQTLKRSPSARLFFETPSIEWILRNQVIWDFFYEHCSYFTPVSLKSTFETAGFVVDAVEVVFGEQYLWLEAHVAPEAVSVDYDAGIIPALAQQFAAAEADLRQQWLDQIKDLASAGRVALWGAGAKGVTFANLIDPAREWITCVVDINPQKQGHYLPGTAHPIVDYQQLEALNIHSIVVLNPNYQAEIENLLRTAHLSSQTITLVGT